MKYELSDKSTPVSTLDRLQLAALCPEYELNLMTAKTNGEFVRELVKRGIIQKTASSAWEQYYTDNDRLRLRCQLRLEWADMMIAEAQKH